METKRSLVDERTPPPSLTPRHSEQQKLHMVMDGHFLLSGQTDEPDPTIDRLSLISHTITATRISTTTTTTHPMHAQLYHQQPTQTTCPPLSPSLYHRPNPSSII